ncbi:ABC transporter ATP-binding protein [Lactobacillus sp. ESL0703]|uniref:ABC transporter ATP-binding protein n=1 Tax=Lactobacillus sp. ESL0703 TaxID=2983218 RepID=UPI0023F7FE76|nr:ABC transporter ATP-binding protein [Lactobacillus sp. ESL0703]MDF7669192.1 ABC transporter ATP-binding protein [Lactobacillus sp. ESL0703]
MLEFNNVSKEYHVGDRVIKALDDVSFKINEHQFTVVLGPSGSGKSTLLNILGGMDRPTKGKIKFKDQFVNELNDRDLTIYRRKVIGFVFQFYNLIPSLTALENVAIAAQLTDNDDAAVSYLQDVGLKERINNFPNQMSGGEMQRVSIARALAKKPQLLLCDEPTGALDSVTSMKIVKILQDIANNTDTAVVMVTHNPQFEQYGNQIIKLKDGKVELMTHKDAVLVGEAE